MTTRFLRREMIGRLGLAGGAAAWATAAQVFQAAIDACAAADGPVRVQDFRRSFPTIIVITFRNGHSS